MSEQNLIVLEIVGNVVSSYVSNHQVNTDELPGLIDSVYAKFRSLGSAGAALGDRNSPAVPVEESITDDYIVCLEDGKQLKMLKRHLKTSYGMTPEQYRERWNLPLDYPMVAPNYAKRRSSLAKDIGLGKSRKKKQQVAA